MRLICIVEGHGDVAALPVLLRRLVPEQLMGKVEFPPPIRLPRSRLVQERELRRVIEFAGRQTGADDAILVLLDADEDCPRTLATTLLGLARQARPDRQIAVVIAKR